MNFNDPKLRRIYDAEYYRKNREKRLAQTTEYSRKNREKKLIDGAKYRTANFEKLKVARIAYAVRNPEKIRAKSTIGKEVKSGRMKRLPCKVCGTARVDGHHPNYSEQLSVIWLCPSHHKRIHSYRKNEKATLQGDLKFARTMKIKRNSTP